MTAFSRGLLIGPQMGRIILKDGGENLEVEVVKRMAELEELIRSTLMSALPSLKTKVN